jgi:acetolactate synthase-1/2/3 large subunit
VQHFHFDYPGQLLTSGGFGTMGFGLGAALGAKVGNPDKTVIHITGDGSFRMNCNELATEQYYDIPVITFIFNNGTLGMVRQWQTLFYEKRYSNTVLARKTDFVRLAEAFGARASRVSTPEEFAAAFDEALACGGPYLIDTIIDMDEFVLPMLPPGGSIDDMIVTKESSRK